MRTTSGGLGKDRRKGKIVTVKEAIARVGG